MNARWEDATTTLKCMDRVRAPIDISKLDGSETIRDAPLRTMTGERVRHLVQCLEHVGEGIFTRCERNSDDAALSFEEMLCPHIPRTPEWERVTKLLARKVMSTTIATMKEASTLLSTKEEKCGLCGELLTDPHESIWQFKGMKVCSVCRDGEKNANVRKEARKCKPTERYNCEHPNFEATRHIVPLMKRLGPRRFAAVHVCFSRLLPAWMLTPRFCRSFLNTRRFENLHKAIRKLSRDEGRDVAETSFLFFTTFGKIG
jgi:hypothetical protein